MKTLETKRLTIRPLRKTDLNALFAITGDATVMRFVGNNQPITLEQTRQWIEVSQRNYATKGYGCMAVIERVSGHFIGYCGLVTGEDTNAPEIIYGLMPSVWGKGYATEAARAMLAFGFTDCTLLMIEATADPNNFASLRVLDRLGFVWAKTDGDVHGLPTAFFQLKASTWFASPPETRA
jgi:RimJ/RimL family protein N-acetyltransferase